MKKRILMLGAAVALALALALPGAILATNTTVVTGNVEEGYTFTAPSAIALGAMTPGTSKIGSSTNGSLVGNNPDGYTVTGVDAKLANKGYMVDTATGETALENPFSIGPTADPLTEAYTSVEFLNTGAPTDASIQLHVSQLATLNDPVDEYTITITFDVSANNP